MGEGIGILCPVSQRDSTHLLWHLLKEVPPCCAISNLMASEMASGMAPEDLKAEVERLRAENEALKKPAKAHTSLKVSEKGALSVYGLGRFPVTLYREQWERLLGMADEIRNFIRENDQALKKKE